MKNKIVGDMPPEEFRKSGHELIDWIADYLINIEEYPVLPNTKPGELKKRFPKNPPENGESVEEILSDIDRKIIPGVTHWNHPKFMAYFNSTSSGPGILAELLTAALNQNGMNWKSSPIAAEMEEVTLDWLRQMLDLPENFWGIIYDTASISSLHAIASAKTQVEHERKDKNLLNKLCFYFSEQAHSSIEKDALFLGIKKEHIRKIKVNKDFKMIPEVLRNQISKDIENNLIPFCVVATVGTTSTTSVDSVSKIAKICSEKNIWLHIDAAHAGIAAIVPEMRFILNGVEHADSIVVNPHKWLFMPIDISVYYTTKPNILKRTFSLIPEYLKTEQDNSAINYMDYGIQLGRRFRSLKLWFVIRYFGVKGLRSIIREHIRVGKLFEELVSNNPQFELLAPVPFSTVCFRAVPNRVISEAQLNELNERLMNEVNRTGKVFLSHTRLYNKFIIRLVVSGIRTKEEHMLEVWALLQKTLSKLIGNEY
ncbi:L-2,4-diaminobutyrate decarboxylase [bacterium BMS3Abin04]|nr:L-2,4-diaminobutyrate decarboxylase [bacterium BMS3Abin04]